MIANYRNGFVWEVMKKNPYIRKGLERAGFEGGWMTPAGAPIQIPANADPKAAAARALGTAESRAAQAAEQQPEAPARNQTPQ